MKLKVKPAATASYCFNSPFKVYALINFFQADKSGIIIQCQPESAPYAVGGNKGLKMAELQLYPFTIISCNHNIFHITTIVAIALLCCEHSVKKIAPHHFRLLFTFS